MAIPPVDPAWIALIGTLMGGVTLKVTEKWLGAGKEKKDDARGIRDELRLTVTSQKDEIQRLEDEVNEWRTKYYDLRDSYVKVQTDLILALNRIKEEAEHAEQSMASDR